MELSHETAWVFLAQGLERGEDTATRQSSAGFTVPSSTFIYYLFIIIYSTFMLSLNMSLTITLGSVLPP